MNKTETNRFKDLYQRHQRLLKLQGKPQAPGVPILGQYVESQIILIAALIK